MAESKVSEIHDFSERVNRQFEEERKKFKKPNILVAGGTGAGKSTLVNLIFGTVRADFGVGKPVTKGVNRHEGELITIFDSEGYESGAQSQSRYKEVVLKLIEDNQDSLENRIHMAWWCISQANHRVLDFDIDTINRIAGLKVPIAVVLTQADEVSQETTDELMKVLRRDCKGISIFETSTNPEVKLSVDSLTTWAFDHLDEAVRAGFVAAAKGAIPLKLREGRKIVVHHIAAAATIAASPIPFSDAPLLVLNQATMIGRIASVWDLPAVQSVTAGGVMAQLVSQLGRTLAGNLLKLIPGIGTVVGDMINAGVASTITGGIGYGVNEICSKIARDELSGVTRQISDYFDANTFTAMVKSYTKEG